MVKGKTKSKKTKTAKRSNSAKHKSKTTINRTYKSIKVKIIPKRRKPVRSTIRVIAAVWAHAGIIPINAIDNQATYTPPKKTNLNLVAFKPHGLCSWGSTEWRSKIDAGITELVTRDGGINDIKDFNKKLTAIHNYGATFANSEEAKVTKLGRSLYGLSTDYGKNKSKGNKFYTPMNDALVDTSHYNKVFVRLYAVESENDNIQINFRSSAGDHTQEVNASLPIASDITFDYPTVRLDEIVKRISDEVRTFIPGRKDVVVNLIDNNCNAYVQGIPGKEIITNSSSSL